MKTGSFIWFADQSDFTFHQLCKADRNRQAKTGALIIARKLRIYLGEFVKNRPITPGDLAATIYTLLGIDPGHELHTPDGRPIRIAPQDSKVILELFG